MAYCSAAKGGCRRGGISTALGRRGGDNGTGMGIEEVSSAGIGTGLNKIMPGPPPRVLAGLRGDVWLLERTRGETKPINKWP